MDKFGSFMLGLLVGASLAGVLAMLYAPQSGEETRRMLSEKGEAARQQAREFAAKAQEGAQRVSEKGQPYMA